MAIRTSTRFRRVITRSVHSLLAGLVLSASVLAWSATQQDAQAWDAHGHRSITWLALDNMDKSAPAWLRDPNTRHSIAWQSAETDRWRGQKNAYIMNSTYMNHFLDVEELGPLGLTLETVSPLRYRFLRDMAIARHEHPTGINGDSKPYNPKFDPTGQSEWPGFVMHASCEQHAILTSQFKTYRMLEKLNDPARAPQLEMAKANIMVTMGILAHWVGDTAQPLHTTRHFNGWIGDNPKNYTTSKKIHVYIDGGVIAHHKLDYSVLKVGQKYDIKIDGTDPWAEVVTYTKRSHDLVEPLYILEQSGELNADAGKTFIIARLQDAGAMLSAMYNNAWQNSEPSDKDLADFQMYDNFDKSQLPESTAAPAQPAPAATTK